MIDKIDDILDEERLKEARILEDEIKKREEMKEELSISSDEAKKSINKEEDEIKKRNGFLNGNDVNMDNEAFTAFALLFSNYYSIVQKGYVDLRNGFNEINIKKQSNTIDANDANSKEINKEIGTLNSLKKEYDQNGRLTKEMLNKTSLSEKTKEELLAFDEFIKDLDSTDVSEEGLPKVAIFDSVLEKSKKNLATSKNTNIKDILAGNIISTIEGEKETTSDKNDNNENEKEKDYDRQRDTLKDTDRLRATAPKLRAR